MMYYYNRLACVVLFVVLVGSVKGYGQKYGEVVYRDYTRMEEAFLDSLKKGGLMASFKGIHALKRETGNVNANTPVIVTLRKSGRKKMKPEEMIEKRRSSVLTVNKYQRETTCPEAVIGWATAVVLTTDGVCVTNYHVFWELLGSTVKLNPLDSIMFVATGEGRVYPITEILSFNQAGDMAFFKIDTRGDVLTPMPLGNDLPAGANVHLLSNPEGYRYTYTHGAVSRTITLNPTDAFANRMEMTADFAKGSSGGPIMDDRGNMVAMVSCVRAIYYSHQPPYYLQMNVKETIPVSLLKRLLHGPNQ